MRISTILVPLDGSVLAESALPFADDIASRCGARLVLIRDARAGRVIGDGPPAEQQRTIEEAEDYLRDTAQKLLTRGLSVETGVPFGGQPADWIVEEADVRKADLIVMATHDRVGPDRWVHGSVAEAVVHRASVPVMLVAGASANNFGGEQPVLLLPLDGSEMAEVALPTTIALAQITGARVVLVGVVPNPGNMVDATGGSIITYGGDDFARMEVEARACLEASFMRLTEDGIPVEFVVGYGDAAVQISNIAKELSAAAVVMATHGRTGVSRLVVGSVAGGVLHHSQVPVVLVHPGTLRAAEQPDPSVTASPPATPALA